MSIVSYIYCVSPSNSRESMHVDVSMHTYMYTYGVYFVHINTCMHICALRWGTWTWKCAVLCALMQLNSDLMIKHNAFMVLTALSPLWWGIVDSTCMCLLLNLFHYLYWFWKNDCIKISNLPASSYKHGSCWDVATSCVNIVALNIRWILTWNN